MYSTLRTRSAELSAHLYSHKIRQTSFTDIMHVRHKLLGSCELYLFQNLPGMRYFATYWLDHQPRVTGCTSGTTDRYESFHEKTLASCHEFTVAGVEEDKTMKVEYCTFAAIVSLIA